MEAIVCWPSEHFKRTIEFVSYKTKLANIVMKSFHKCCPYEGHSPLTYDFTQLRLVCNACVVFVNYLSDLCHIVVWRFSAL